MSGVGDMSDEELVQAAGEGVGSEPAVRPRAAAEQTRRLTAAIRELTAETRSSGRTMVRLTWAVVALTVVLVVIGIVALID